MTTRRVVVLALAMVFLGTVAAAQFVSPPSSMYVAGATELPNTTAAGAGVLTLGGNPFLHNYGPAADAGNTFVGQQAGNFTMGGVNSWEGKYNTASGFRSLVANTTGNQNTASGYASMWSNTTGSDNTASGYGSLGSNTTVDGNTAFGYSALLSQSFSNSDTEWASFNTAVGYQALFSNQPTSTSNGIQNTAVGFNALYANTTGFYNTAIGSNTGNRSDTVNAYGGGTVTFVPSTTGSYNTFLGYGTGATAQVDNCTAVDVDAYCDATNQVRLGNVFVSSIGGKVGWSALSDVRAKADVRDLPLGLGFVLALRPVEYTLRGGNGQIHMGFVAQDIEALLGEGYNVLDIGGDAERTLSLRHTDLIAPLVKAVQEQQAHIESRDARIAALDARLAAIEARLEDR